MAQHEQASDGDPATEHTHGNACPRLTCWLAGGGQFVNNFTMAFCRFAKFLYLFLLGHRAIAAAGTVRSRYLGPKCNCVEGRKLLSLLTGGLKKFRQDASALSDYRKTLGLYLCASSS